MMFRKGDDELKKEFAKTWPRYWKDERDRNLMKLKLYAGDEWIERFGPEEATGCLKRLEECQNRIDHYAHRVEES